MADDEKPTGGIIPGPVQQFVAQLRRMTADLESLTGLGGPLPARAAIPMMPGLPLPGALSAKELKYPIASNVTAQRRSIQALQVRASPRSRSSSGCWRASSARSPSGAAGRRNSRN